MFKYPGGMAYGWLYSARPFAHRAKGEVTMLTKTKRFTMVQITTIGIFAALVFVTNYLQIPIPLAVGGNTRLHLGNVMCLLSGFVLGPVGGGLAAGIGSELYDLLLGDFIYIPFYFVFKFLLAFVGAVVANVMQKKGVKPVLSYIVGAIAGQLVYIVLHLTRALFFDMFLYKVATEALLVNLTNRALSSTVNAVLAVVGSTILASVLVPVYKKIRDKE